MKTMMKITMRTTMTRTTAKNTVMVNPVMKDKRTGTTLMRKCMFTTSAAKIADITAAGAKKDREAASSIQETITSVFRKHAGAISGKEKSSHDMKGTMKGTVTADERICCRE